jgi:hypothetical protein
MKMESGSPKRRSAEVPGITGLRLLPGGAEASLVNISPTGLLADSPARMRVGAAVQVAFEGGFSPASVTGRVSRCEVAVMGRDGLLRYRIAIEFDSMIPFDDQAGQSAAAPASKAVRNRW